MDDTMLGYIARTTAIEQIIDILAHADDPNNESVQYDAQQSVGIWFSSMTTEEKNYIVDTVNRQWSWFH